MPFTRKRIKVISDGPSGRSNTKWVRPSADKREVNTWGNNGEDLQMQEDDQQIRQQVDLGLGQHGDDDESGEFFDGEFGENQATKRRTYQEIKAKDVRNWSSLRKRFIREAILQEAPPSSLRSCLRCGANFPIIESTGKPVLYHCVDCGPFFFTCKDCMISEHELRPHHIPLQWNGQNYSKFKINSFDSPARIPNLIHSCNSKFKRCVKVVNIKGDVDDCMIEFCECEPEAIKLFKLGLWSSSSIKPTTAYSIDLLKTLKALMLECHVSVLGFTNAMRWRNGLTKAQANSLYRLLVNESFEEYRHFTYRFETMEAICEDIDDGSYCMLCPKNADGQVVLMLDGTFGCVRKQSSGASIEQPKHRDRFFIEQTVVDEFVENHAEQNNKDIRLDCSNFKAGADRIRSKVQNGKLDITGIFGCSCKHEIPGRFLSMKHGERLGYPICLLTSFMEKYKNLNTSAEVNYGVLYDISCMLYKHIKKSKLEDQFQHCLFATPDWHAYGHVASCQVNFAVRYVAEFGLTDGEGVERLWSYLRQFTAITKEMTPSHRIDLLTDGLLHYARRKNENMEFTIIERAEKANQVFLTCQEELEALYSSTTTSFIEEDIKQWHESEKLALSRRHSNKRNDSSWTDLYVEKLLALKIARNLLQSCTTVLQIKQVRQHINELDRELKVIERRQGLKNRWNEHCLQFKDALREFEDKKKLSLLVKARSDAMERIFHIALKRKYSAGQMIPKRIETMIKKSTKNLNATVQKYNASLFASASDMPSVVSFVDLKDPEGAIYETLDLDVMVPSAIPPSVRRKAVSMYFRKERARFEKRHVEDESKRMINYLENRLFKIRHSLHDLAALEGEVATNNAFNIGSIAMLTTAANSLEKRISSCREVLSKYVPDIRIPSNDLPIEDPEAAGMNLQLVNDEAEKLYDSQLNEFDLDDFTEELSDIDTSDDES